MKIGELSAATGTTPETIRFYEKEHLLPEMGRSEGNYRIYGQAHVERLTFIRHCRSLDMALDEIRTLLSFKASPEENCGAVNELLDEHIGHVTARIRELRALEKQLKTLRDQCCEATAASECGILKGLSEELPQELARQSPGGHAHHVHRTH